MLAERSTLRKRSCVANVATGEKQMRSFTLIFVLLIISLGGCRIKRANHSLFKSDLDRSNDQLWRDGYGFNNPNNDRTNHGLEPVNFDGRTEAASVGERAFGNVVSLAIFEGIPAVWRGLTRR